MSKLWQDQLTDELMLRGMEERTRGAYLESIRHFVDFFDGRDPSEIEVKEARQYQLYLIEFKKLAPNSVNRNMDAIRFFYRNVLERPMDSLPRVKVPKKLQMYLSEMEVTKMIESLHNVFYKAVLLLAYSSGLRNEELRSLKTGDIDSARMVICVRQGKGKKDRQVPLSPLALLCLRTYWRLYRVHNKIKSDWLFIPSKQVHGGEIKNKLSHTALGYMFDTARDAAGIKKKLLPIC